MAKTEQYKTQYCQMLIDHMKDGHSFASFGAKIDQGRTTLYDWLERHPEFREAKEIAENKALNLIETVFLGITFGRQVGDLEMKKVNMAGLIFWLKTRGRKEYSEKYEVELKQDEPIKLAYTNE
jgi:hypothetical protein